MDRAAIPVPPAKLIFDKVLGCLLIAATAPIWFLIILAIVIETIFRPANRGGILHTETRVSVGRPFHLYKFRILKRGAEDRIRRGAVPKVVENESANLTGVGRVLKKYGLDELAQLINVLKGDMSFVGPRPKPTAEYMQEMTLGRFFRARVRAGLTGPVQVMKGTRRTAEDEVKADWDYAELLRSGSQLRVLLFDWRIVWRTLAVMIKGTGE